MKNKQIPYDILARYIRQECMDDELRYIEEWINSSNENRKLFEQLLHEWQYIYSSPEELVFPDKNNIWDNIQTQLFPSIAPAVLYSKRTLIKICSIAAMITLLVGAAVTLVVKSSVDNTFLSESITTVETMQGQKKCK